MGVSSLGCDARQPQWRPDGAVKECRAGREPTLKLPFSRRLGERGRAEGALLTAKDAKERQGAPSPAPSRHPPPERSGVRGTHKRLIKPAGTGVYGWPEQVGP